MRTRTNSTIDYINRLFAPETSQHKIIRDALTKDNKLGINIDSFEGQFLKLLVELHQPKKIIEVGTLYGYSTLWLAQAAKPFNGTVYSFEKDRQTYDKAREFLKLEDNIQLSFGDALENLIKAETQGPFDMIFIDANKSAYPNYLTWAEKNIRKGGLILGDNTLLFGNLCSDQPQFKVSQKTIDAMNDFNKRLADPTKYTSILVPTPEGLTIALKNF